MEFFTGKELNEIIQNNLIVPGLKKKSHIFSFLSPTLYMKRCLSLLFYFIPQEDDRIGSEFTPI